MGVETSGSKNLLDKVVARSLRLLRMSSSRAFVAALRLTRSVALSLLRLLSCDISCCSAVAMPVRLIICDERESTSCGGCCCSSGCGSGSGCCCGDCGLDEFVESFKTLAGSSKSSGTCIFCSASIVAEGGVFSPNIGFDKYRLEGRAVFSTAVGDGVLYRFGEGLFSPSLSLPPFRSKRKFLSGDFRSK